MPIALISIVFAPVASSGMFILKSIISSSAASEKLNEPHANWGVVLIGAKVVNVFVPTHESGSLSLLTIASNVAPDDPPINSCADLSVCSIILTLLFPIFSRTSSPVTLAPLQDRFVPVPLLSSTAVCPGVTAPDPKSNKSVVKFIPAESVIVTLTSPVSFVVAIPVNSVPIKNNDIAITAIEA